MCITFEPLIIFLNSALKTKIRESKDGHFLEKDKRILEELKSLHCDPHPFFRVFPSESDFSKSALIAAVVKSWRNCEV